MRLGELYNGGYEKYQVTGTLNNDTQSIEVTAKCPLDAKHIARDIFIHTLNESWRYVPLEAIEVQDS
jgi:hypothetical protein